MKHSFQILLGPLLTVCVLSALIGCSLNSMASTSELTISIAIEVDEPVADGLSVQTPGLGQVHLDKAIFSATYVDTDLDMFDVTFSQVSTEPFLYIPARLFLNREGVSGMDSAEILEKLSSPELSPGKSIFLIADTGDKRVIHKLTTTWEDDPGVFVQSALGEADHGLNQHEVEVRQILNENDPGGVEMKTTFGNVEETYWVSPPQFTIHQGTFCTGIPWRFHVGSFAERLSGTDGEASASVISQEELKSWNGKPVIVTGTSQSKTLGGNSKAKPLQDEKGDKEPVEVAKALFWASLPGLHLKIDTPTLLEEIKADLRSLGFRFYFQWYSVDFEERGASVGGGTL